MDNKTGPGQATLMVTQSLSGFLIRWTNRMHLSKQFFTLATESTSKQMMVTALNRSINVRAGEVPPQIVSCYQYVSYSQVAMINNTYHFM